jgi:hypothetical protein
MRLTSTSTALLLGLALLAGCGSPLKDCTSATELVIAAQLASDAAARNAANNPQSANMQKLATAAATTLTLVQLNRDRVCASPVNTLFGG